MTKDEWHHEWRRVYDELGAKYPHKDPKWRFHEAHRLMRKSHGYEPPGWLGAALKALFGFAKSGGTMNWDWTKTLWKSVRGALGAAVVVGVLALLGAFDTTEELTASGMPTWLAPVVAMGVAALISWLRNWISISRPQWNVVKKAGDKIRPALKG